MIKGGMTLDTRTNISFGKVTYQSLGDNAYRLWLIAIEIGTMIGVL